MKSILCVAAIMSATASFAHAEQTAVFTPGEDRTGFGVNLGVSTLGATVEPSWRISNRFGMSAVYGEGSFSYAEDSDGESFNGDAHAGGFGVMADFYPTGKSLHISAGAFKTDYSADLQASDVEVDGARGDIAINLDQKDEGIAPYLGVGYDGRIGKSGAVSLGLGAIFV